MSGPSRHNIEYTGIDAKITSITYAKTGIDKVAAAVVQIYKINTKKLLSLLT